MNQTGKFDLSKLLARCLNSKKKHSPKFGQFFQNIPPTFPPKFPNFPNGLNGPEVLVAKKNPQRLLGLRTRRRTNAHPEEYRWTLTTSPGIRESIRGDLWWTGESFWNVAMERMVCKSPPFLWFTYPKKWWVYVAKRSKPLFQFYLFQTRKFLEKYPLSVYRSLTKKNACKWASDAPKCGTLVPLEAKPSLLLSFGDIKALMRI